MISSLAFHARVFGEPRYRIAAGKAAEFIMHRLLTKEGRLRHRYRDGEAAMPGTLSDYAFLSRDYWICMRQVLILSAMRPTPVSDHDRSFWDESGGGFYLTAQDAEQLLFRPKEVYDGAILGQFRGGA